MNNGGSLAGVNAGWMELWGNGYLDSTATNRYVQNGVAGLYQVGAVGSNPHVWLIAPSGTAGNAISFTQAMTLDNSGNLLLGTTGEFLSTNTFYKASGASNPALSLLKNSSASSTDQAFCVANGLNGGTVSFQVLASGNAQNTNNSYGAISDVKLKANIADATPKLADLMKVQIRQYTLKSDLTSMKHIGVVAQELEQVFPAMIEEIPDYDQKGAPLGTTTKTVKYSVFVPMLVKALQEQQAIITQMQATLKSAGIAGF
jgi:hypothetical protein